MHFLSATAPTFVHIIFHSVVVSSSQLYVLLLFQRIDQKQWKSIGLDLIGRLIYLQYCVSCTSSVAGSRLCLRLARVDISSLAHVQASTQHTAAEGN